MSMTKENKIIEKVKKLFALAANEGSQGAEADNALRMANKLLEKHAIEKHQLHEKETTFANFKDYPISNKWVSGLCSTICKLYNCRVIYDYNWKPAKTIIIGTESNRMTAIIVIEQLMAQIKKDTKGENAAFKNGAVIGLQKVVNQIIKDRQEEQAEAIPGTGIMVVDLFRQDKQDANNFVKDNFSNLTTSKGGRGSAAGAEYGSGLNPGARVTGSAQRRIA